MHSKSDNIEAMISNKPDEDVKKLFESPLHRYYIALEKSMKGSDFIFNCINLLHYKCHKINLNHYEI